MELRSEPEERRFHARSSGKSVNGATSPPTRLLQEDIATHHAITSSNPQGRLPDPSLRPKDNLAPSSPEKCDRPLCRLPDGFRHFEASKTINLRSPPRSLSRSSKICFQPNLRPKRIRTPVRVLTRKRNPQAFDRITWLGHWWLVCGSFTGAPRRIVPLPKLFRGPYSPNKSR